MNLEQVNTLLEGLNAEVQKYEVVKQKLETLQQLERQLQMFKDKEIKEFRINLIGYFTISISTIQVIKLLDMFIQDIKSDLSL